MIEPQVEYDFYLPNKQKLTFSNLDFESMTTEKDTLVFTLIIPPLPEQIQRLFDNHVFTKIVRVPYIELDSTITDKLYQVGNVIIKPTYYFETINSHRVKLIITGRI